MKTSMFNVRDAEFVKQCHIDITPPLRMTEVTLTAVGSVTDTYTMEKGAGLSYPGYQSVFGKTNSLKTNYPDNLAINGDVYFCKINYSEFLDNLGVPKFDPTTIITITTPDNIKYNVVHRTFNTLYNVKQTITYFCNKLV